eukprot:5686804-Prymnesium_polylepis.1
MRCGALCPPHSTAQAEVCERVGSRGSLELDVMEQRVLRTQSPLLGISVGQCEVGPYGSAP